MEMRHTITAAVMLAFGAAAAHAQSHAAPELKWGPAPPIFAPGAQLAVLAGDPFKTGEYTVRLKMPNGYKIAPHWHPTDENVTVVSGAFKVGMGKTFDAAKMMTLPAGGFIVAPAKEPHFAEAKGETVVQVHGMGPFQLTYVNPADTPKAAAAK
jgi:quercetin dioxygenase-like cupin family protein